MIDFLIKSTVCLSVFLVFYHLVLEREKIHHFNRFYLLISVAISFVIPFLTYEVIQIIPVQEASPLFFTDFTSNSVITVPEPVNYLPAILWGLYGIVTLFLFIRFGNNIYKILRKTRLNKSVTYKNAKLVLLKEQLLPHTFWNTIFISEDDYISRSIEVELYTHEITHVTQKHTLDVLFVETLKTIFWFNPLFYFYKRAIQLNHEFLADENVVKSYNNVPFYQNILLQKTNGFQTIYLASNLNYLVTKKRLIMMTKKTSKTIAIIKKVTIIPILITLIYFFCIEIMAQEKVTRTKETVKKDGTNEDKIRDSYYEGVWVKIFDERKNKKVNALYEDLSLEDRRKYLSYVPKAFQKISLSEKEFSDFKDSKKYAIWIDAKHVSNKELDKYDASKFVYLSGSSVLKNARSKKFPHPFQYSLYTNDYFEKNLKNSHLKFGGKTIKIGYSNYNTLITKQKLNGVKNKKKAVAVLDSKTTNGDSIRTGYIKINNQSCFYITNNKNETEYYNRWGFKINKNGEILNQKIDDEGKNKIIKGKEYTIKSQSTTDGVLIEQGYLNTKDNTKFFYIKKGDDVKYYTRWGDPCNKEGVPL